MRTYTLRPTSFITGEYTYISLPQDFSLYETTSGAANYYGGNNGAWKAFGMLFDADTLAHIANQNVTSALLSFYIYQCPLSFDNAVVGSLVSRSAVTIDGAVDFETPPGTSTRNIDVSSILSLHGFAIGVPDNSDVFWATNYARIDYTSSTNPITLTIVTDEEQRTLSYNANGGSGAPSAQTVWGDSYSSETTVSTTTPTRTGYSFTGWNTSQDGSGTPYAAGDSITIYDNTTLYAQWSALKSVISSVGDGDTGSTITVQWNAQGNFAHTLAFSLGSAAVTGVQVAAGTNQYRFTIPTSWNAQLPTTTSGVATVTLTTIADGTNIGTDSDTFTVSVPASVVPSIGSLTAAKVNNNQTVAAWDIYLQSHSQVALTASSLAAGDGSTISSVRFTGDNCDVTNYTSSASTTATSNVIESYGSLTYTAVITDSRGRTATRTVTINVTQYSKPTVTFFYGWRCDADGTTNPVTGESLSAQVRYSYTNINGNTITNTLSYKKTTETNWTTAFTDVATGAYKVFAIDTADMASTYDLQFAITDTLQNTTTVYAKVSSVVGIAFGLKNDRARFGGACRQSGLEIDWQTQIDNRLSIKTDNAYPFRVFNANGDKALDMINYNGTAMFSMYDAGVERNYIGQGRFSTYDSAGNEVDRVSQGGSFFGSDVTFRGVLDVTQRRCYAMLSSAGWYRAMIADYPSAETGFMRGKAAPLIRFGISRKGDSATSETHEILLMAGGWDVIKFIDEKSACATLLIDKIRYTYNSSNSKACVDIHYTSSNSNAVGVTLDVTAPTLAIFGQIKAASLQAVADAPSGETILVTKEFAANTKGMITSPAAAISGTRIVDSECARSGDIAFYTFGVQSDSYSTPVSVTNGSVIATGFLKPLHQTVVTGTYWNGQASPLRCVMATNGTLVVYWDDGQIPVNGSAMIFNFSYVIA